MNDPLFVVIGAVFVILGIAAALNIGGAADRFARFNSDTRDSSQRARELAESPHGVYPESRGGMRLWGVAAVVAGLLCVWAGFW